MPLLTTNGWPIAPAQAMPRQPLQKRKFMTRQIVISDSYLLSPFAHIEPQDPPEGQAARQAIQAYLDYLPTLAEKIQPVSFRIRCTFFFKNHKLIPSPAMQQKKLRKKREKLNLLLERVTHLNNFLALSEAYNKQQHNDVANLLKAPIQTLKNNTQTCDRLDEVFLSSDLSPQAEDKIIKDAIADCEKTKEQLIYLLQALKSRQHYFTHFLPAEMQTRVQTIETQTLRAAHIKPAPLLTLDVTETQHIQAIMLQLDRLLEGKYHQVKKELTQGIHTLFSDITLVTAHVNKTQALITRLATYLDEKEITPLATTTEKKAPEHSAHTHTAQPISPHTPNKLMVFFQKLCTKMLALLQRFKRWITSSQTHHSAYGGLQKAHYTRLPASPPRSSPSKSPPRSPTTPRFWSSSPRPPRPCSETKKSSRQFFFCSLL